LALSGFGVSVAVICIKLRIPASQISSLAISASDIVSDSNYYYYDYYYYYSTMVLFKSEIE